MEDISKISFDDDIHICGSCKVQESTIEKFMNHKRICPKSRKTVISQGIRASFHDLRNFTEECISLIDQNERGTELSPLILQQADVYDIQSENCENIQYGEYTFSSANEVVVGERENTQSVSPGAFINTGVEPIQNEENIAGNNLKDTVNPFENGEGREIIIEKNGSSKISTNLNEQLITLPKKPQIKYELVVDPKSKSKRYFCRCENCSFSSIYMKDLVRHSVVHTGIKPYTCKHCDKSFSRVDKLRTHELTHTGVKPHKCPHCNYAALLKGDLAKHLRIHKDERPYKCQICEYASRNSSQLIVHLRRHTGDTPFHCTQCKKKFKINHDLRRHMLLHSGEKPFSCTQCSFQCSQRGNLIKHTRLFHNEANVLNCKHCPFTTTAKTKFREHEWCHRNKPLRCNQCPYNASTHRALKIHQSVHSNNKPFHCEHCSFASRQPCNIITHTKTKHPEKLNDHERIQNQSLSFKNKVKMRESEQNRQQFCTKNFKCHICDATFVRKNSLAIHLRHHQNQTTQRNLEPNLGLDTNVEKSDNQGGSSSTPALNEAKSESDVRPIDLTVNCVPATEPSSIIMPSDLIMFTQQQDTQLMKMDMVFLN